MTKPEALVLLVATAALALAGACTSSSSSPPPTETDAPDAAPADAASPCKTCVTTACASVRTACDAEPTCATHAACVDACPTDEHGVPTSACVDACPAAEGTAAVRRRVAYDSCVLDTGVRGCAACAGAVDAGSGSDLLTQTCKPSTETDECFKCEDEKCCDTYAACVAVPACKQDLQPCLVACKSDLACIAGCYDKYPTGVPAWARRTTCVSTLCASECNKGPVDACVACSTVNECRDTYVACHGDPTCFGVFECVRTTCPDVTEACLNQCAAKGTPRAKALYDAWVACTVTACSGPCGT